MIQGNLVEYPPFVIPERLEEVDPDKIVKIRVRPGGHVRENKIWGRLDKIYQMGHWSSLSQQPSQVLTAATYNHVSEEFTNESNEC